MRRWISWIGLFGLVAGVLATWLVVHVGEASFRYPEGAHRFGRLRYVKSVPILEVWGEPEQIGQAVARLGVLPAERLRQYPRELFFGVMPRFIPQDWQMQAWQEVLAAGERLINNFPERYKREYEALKKHVPEHWHEGLLAGNTLFDIKRIVHCSAVIVESPSHSKDGRNSSTLLMGRNLDFPTLGYLHQYGLVLIYRPNNRYAFAAVGFPGMIGVLSGVNEHGLCIAMLEVYETGDGSPAFNPQGVPYAICVRRLLEECRDVTEARRLLSQMPRTCYFNLAVCDTKTGGIFEVSPQQICYRGLERGLCACTNMFLSEPLQVKDGKNWYRSRERLAELLRLREETAVGVQEVHRALHRANLGAVTLQTMIFEPQTLRLHLAMGSCPASALPLVCLELRDWLKPASEARW
ncbi:MAG: C45 family peptidase [Gemmatales bacterium]|nr:C45 family peptidase [Gemmatales bacterium]MDW7995859.1 C45 family peptidase [Gemmatales bacterium]